MPNSFKILRLRLHDVPIALQDMQDPPTALSVAAARKLQLTQQDVGTPIMVRRALDVRGAWPQYRVTVDVELPEKLGRQLIKRGKAELVKKIPQQRWRCVQPINHPPPVVVGAGPAGLFAALRLAEAGFPPILVERGRPVETRARDVSQLYAHGVLQTDSNVCYGEGGAGTFSDGKLYTRIGDARIHHIMQDLVTFGAKEAILIDNRPHLGTDRLVVLLAHMRARLQALGVRIHYETAMQNIDIADGALRGIVLRNGDYIPTNHAVLATGHSAHNVWQQLLEHGLPLECRPFAMGFRVEHPQALINTLRYKKAAHLDLPAADYRLTYQEKCENPRGVYSFCMCPGGVVVTTPTEPQALCINGMSHAARRGRFANSALVVSVTPKDYAAQGHTGVLAGVAFQRAIEAQAYKAGGGAFTAPACRLTDFLNGHTSSTLPATSYRRGLNPADLSALYPQEITHTLRHAISQFAQTMPGFLTEEAVLIGVETRTAAPVRVPRDVSYQALGARGLYPAGEGMGYGGGIISAAVDGVRVAEAMLQSIGAECLS